MCLLFETIKILNGKAENLELHEQRLKRSRQKVFGINEEVSLSHLINVPGELRTGTIKCRIVYGKTIESVEFVPYVPAGVKTLKLVYDDDIDYSLKYTDRSRLLMHLDRDRADDILIVQNGMITDTSFSNIVFTDGVRFVSPSAPLLRGTMREKLLSDGLISEEKLTAGDLDRFTHFRLINAMLGFDAPLLPVSNIIR